MLKRLWNWLTGQKAPDLSKVSVEAVNEVADIRTTIDLMQHLVNTVLRISEEHGSTVGEWTMMDVADMGNCFERMSKNQEEN